MICNQCVYQIYRIIIIYLCCKHLLLLFLRGITYPRRAGITFHQDALVFLLHSLRCSFFTDRSPNTLAEGTARARVYCIVRYGIRYSTNFCNKKQRQYESHIYEMHAILIIRQCRTAQITTM